MKTKIIVCYHKDFNRFENEVLLPLHVGKAVAKTKIEGIQGDDEGENISSKNGSYCELTGLYWLFKNVEADNYGLFHYRRFLDVQNKYKGQIYPSLLNLDDWNSENLEKLMNEYDVILPERNKFKFSAYDRYKKDHIIKDLDTVIDIIKNDYPEYLGAVKRGFFQKDEYSCNTFIMRKNVFTEYCTWLFDILSKAEKRIDTENYDPYQKRVFGFLSERMLKVFIEYKLEKEGEAFKICHCPKIMINEEPLKVKKFPFGEYVNYPDKTYFSLFGIKLTRKKN